MERPLTITTEIFVERMKRIYGDKYDYSPTKYRGCLEKIEIVCPQHGSFWKTPGNHMVGAGCPMCNGYRIKKHTPSISDSNVLPDDRLDELKTKYNSEVGNISEKSTIQYFKTGIVILVVDKRSCMFLPEELSSVIDFVLRGKLDGEIWTSSNLTLHCHWTKKAFEKIIQYVQNLPDFPHD
jgi:hypothetical protein